MKWLNSPLRVTEGRSNSKPRGSTENIQVPINIQ